MFLFLFIYLGYILYQRWRKLWNVILADSPSRTMIINFEPVEVFSFCEILLEKGFRMFRLISRSGCIDPETESWPAKKDGRRANQPEEKQSCGTTWIINMGELINLRNNRAAELPGCLARLAQSNIFQDLKIVCQVCSPPSVLALTEALYVDMCNHWENYVLGPMSQDHY